MKYFLFLFLIVVPISSYADPSKELYIEGVGEISAGRFNSAILVWEKAYKIKPDLRILYNMAQASSRAGRPDDAKQYINKMFSNHTAEELLPFKQKAAAAMAAYRRQAKAINFAKNIREIQIVERDRLREESKTLETWTWMGWTGTAFTLLGAGGLAAGFVLNEEIVDLKKSLDVESGTVTDFRATNDVIEDKKSIGQIAIVGGVSLLAVGVTLIVWDLSTTTETFDVQFAFDGRRVGGRFVWAF